MKWKDRLIKRSGAVLRKCRAWLKFMDDTLLLSKLGIFIFCVLIAIAWSKAAPDFWPDYQVEFVGMIFDIVFILILFSFFERRRQRQQDIKRQEETIQDYKRWDSEEARYRLAGAIRRLNQMGVHRIDFSGTTISDFSFSKHEIESIEGSNFYDGGWGQPTRQTQVACTRVAFDWLVCRNVCFSLFDPLEGLANFNSGYAKFEDCSFINCDLSGAIFNGSSLWWSDVPPKTLFAIEEDDSGQQYSIPTGYGPFSEANLKHATFTNVDFRNADFRGANNIETANFAGAKGLETAYFDTEEIKKQVLDMARTQQDKV